MKVAEEMRQGFNQGFQPDSKKTVKDFKGVAMKTKDWGEVYGVHSRLYR